MLDIITKEFQEKAYVPDALKNKFKDKKVCFFDIETTGFNRIHDKIVLIGVSYFYDDKLIIKQFFVNNLEEERDLLLNFKNFIKEFDILVNYNGDTFDIPFINSKFNLYDFNFNIKEGVSLDLLKIVRKNSNFISLDNHKLKTVERALGINREDEISGKDSVKLYKEYIKSKDTYLKDMILKHNFDDIYYLPRILKIFDIIEENSKVIVPINQYNKPLDIVFNLDDLKVQDNFISIDAKTLPIDLPEEIHFQESYTLKWTPNKGILNLTFEVHEGNLSEGRKCLYLNKNIYPFPIRHIDKSHYKVPNNIIILRVKNLLLINLKPLLREIVTNIFSINKP